MSVLNKLPADFDPNTYLLLHEDVRIRGIDPVKHYLMYGFYEKRAYKQEIKTLEVALAEFLTTYPCEQNSFDIFGKSWSSNFDGVLTNGTANLSDDPRIHWLLDQIDINNKEVLELGPLEAGHTYMLEKSGANVLAIEANKGAFLRCLIVKNYLNLSAKFLLGNFEKLNFNNRTFDLVVASGILYHMSDPVELLKSISSISNKIFLWTHYFEPDLSLWSSSLKSSIDSGKWEINNPHVTEYGGLGIRCIKQYYGEALGWSGFCGGTDVYSYWIFKEDLLSLLQRLGYNDIKISFDNVSGKNGPSFCVLAQK